MARPGDRTDSSRERRSDNYFPRHTGKALADSRRLVKPGSSLPSREW